MPKLNPCPQCSGTSVRRQRIITEEITVTEEGALIEIRNEEHEMTIMLTCLLCDHEFDHTETRDHSSDTLVKQNGDGFR